MEQFGTQGAAELSYLIGYYCMVSVTLNRDARPEGSSGPRSDSDVFTPTGRTKIQVTWELSVRDIGGGKSEPTNRVRSYATDEFLTFLARQGIPFDQFRAQRQPASIAHRTSGASTTES